MREENSGVLGRKQNPVKNFLSNKMIDLLQGNHRGCKTVAQLGQQHSVPEALLQLHRGRKLLLQAGLHPAESREKLLTPSGKPQHFIPTTRPSLPPSLPLGSLSLSPASCSCPTPNSPLCPLPGCSHLLPSCRKHLDWPILSPHPPYTSSLTATEAAHLQ